MKKSHLKKYSLPMVFVLLAALLVSSSALAAPAPLEGEIELEGEVTAIDEEAGTFILTVENELGELEEYSVLVAGNFDFETLNIGDLVEVKGTTNEDGTLVLSEYKIQERARDREQEREGEEDGECIFCTDPEKTHPVMEKIAETYGVEYAVVLDWFCGENHVGLGQIMLALQTAAATGDSADTYLQQRNEGMGWGQIWQETGEKGKPDKQDPPGQLKKQDQDGDPEGKVPPGQAKKQGQCEGEEAECDAEWLPPGLQNKGEKVPPGQLKK